MPMMVPGMRGRRLRGACERANRRNFDVMHWSFRRERATLVYIELRFVQSMNEELAVQGPYP